MLPVSHHQKIEGQGFIESFLLMLRCEMCVVCKIVFSKMKDVVVQMVMRQHCDLVHSGFLMHLSETKKLQWEKIIALAPLGADST